MKIPKRGKESRTLTAQRLAGDLDVAVAEDDGILHTDAFLDHTVWTDGHVRANLSSKRGAKIKPTMV